MQRMAERASSRAQRVLSRRARHLYWLTLLTLYARRLRGTSCTALRHWPEAEPAAGRRLPILSSGPISRDLLDTCDDPTTRRADAAAIAELVGRLEARLTFARASGLSKSSSRPAAFRAIPSGGDARLPLRFQSDAERLAMAPELDHAYVSEARAAWLRERCSQDHSGSLACGTYKAKG